MTKKNLKQILVACVVIIGTLGSMSLILSPKIVGADDGLLVSEKPMINVNVPVYNSHGSMSITGTAVIECAPDQLTIILRIKAESPNSIKEATDQVATMLNNLIISLQKLGISKDDIESTSYSITPKYDPEYDENGHYVRDVFRYYEVVNTVKIKIKDFDKAGKVIDAAADAGALVDNINFELSDEKRNELKIQVMTKAAEDAKLKADAVITALGEELGHVTSVNLNDYYYQPYNYWDRSVCGFSLDESKVVPPTSILPTDLTISANVNVVFDIV
jgi:uncharacterized protein YggE